MAHLLSVNLARPRPNPAKPDSGSTGIDKRPVEHEVRLRAPGPKTGGLGSGLIGDSIFDSRNHGGDDQAVYAYSRESLDHWERELGRELTGGSFGENLTTAGLDVDRALIGERWRIGDQVVLEVSSPRIPCSTFARWLDERGWVKRFAQGALPGAYLRIVEPGVIRAGDPVTVEHRPDHDVTVELCFRALMTEARLLHRLVDVDALPEEVRELARKRTGGAPPFDPQEWETDD
ncbi:MOSC domain-containing protein [Kitasatospora sp. NPDC088346]|uniref:MOSC domain-containing protein n=1 Tax=Kitasatospora sp. NPDC088346 TaxID=3364073 RepID=UPI0037F411F0